MRWNAPDAPPSKHPYRDSAIIYAVLGLIIIAITALTGGGMTRGVVVAIAFFVVATAWSWWRFRQRIQERGRP